MEDKQLRNDQQEQNNLPDQNENRHTENLNETTRQENQKQEDDPVIVSGTGNRLGNVLKVDRG